MCATRPCCGSGQGRGRDHPLGSRRRRPGLRSRSLATRAVNFDAVKFLNQIRSPRQLVIYPNTNSGYGTSSGESHCTEDTPLEPISLYGRTKCQAEAKKLLAQTRSRCGWPRSSGLSPRMRLDLLVNHFVYVAVTDGHIIIFEKDFKRNFVHIRDVADCFLYCIAHARKMIGSALQRGARLRPTCRRKDWPKLVQKYVPRFVVHYSEIDVDPDKRDYVVSNQRGVMPGSKPAARWTTASGS